jgi:hypothetical protein
MSEENPEILNDDREFENYNFINSNKCFCEEAAVLRTHYRTSN